MSDGIFEQRDAVVEMVAANIQHDGKVAQFSAKASES
jgi:hypothetical protein